MEIIGILAAILVIVLLFKLIGTLLHLSIWVITLPFKILGAFLGIIIFIAVLIPAGIVGAMTSIIVLPLALLIPLLPFLIIAFGLWLIFRNN